MHKLEHDKLVETLNKIHAVLAEQGLPKGSVKISFDAVTLDSK